MVSQKKSRKNNHKSERQSTAGSRGEIRKDHFNSGGSLAEWRGTSSVHKNRKDKRSNRTTKKNKAIQESQDDSNE